MSDIDQPNQPTQPENPEDNMDQTTSVLMEIAGKLRDKSVNFVVIVNDGKRVQWTFSDDVWAYGACNLFAGRMQMDWDNAACDDEDDD